MEQLDPRRMAEHMLALTEPRWSHVQGVASAASRIVRANPRVGSAVVDAAWLHDIGYAPSLKKSGFHPLDGARFLAHHGCAAEVVRLVAFHTGAEYEARERGVRGELEQFERPDQARLDALILADLSVSPTGSPVSPDQRIAEILTRYPPTHPVHRAVTRSREYLMECAGRAAVATGSPHEWGFAAA
jgi:hypothetical protein